MRCVCGGVWWCRYNPKNGHLCRKRGLTSPEIVRFGTFFSENFYNLFSDVFRTCAEEAWALDSGCLGPEINCFIIFFYILGCQEADHAGFVSQGNLSIEKLLLTFSEVEGGPCGFSFGEPRFGTAPNRPELFQSSMITSDSSIMI